MGLKTAMTCFLCDTLQHVTIVPLATCKCHPRGQEELGAKEAAFLATSCEIVVTKACMDVLPKHDLVPES